MSADSENTDLAAELTEEWVQYAVQQARQPIEPGEPGECAECGEHSQRLVRGVCAPCRDELGLG